MLSHGLVLMLPALFSCFCSGLLPCNIVVSDLCLSIFAAAAASRDTHSAQQTIKMISPPLNRGVIIDMQLQGLLHGVLEPEMDKNFVPVGIYRALTKPVVHVN